MVPSVRGRSVHFIFRLTILHSWIIRPLIEIYLYPSRHPSRFMVSAVNRLGVVLYCRSRMTEVWVCLETAASVHRGLAFIQETANLLRTTTTLAVTHIKIPLLSANPVNMDIINLDHTTVQIPNTNPSSPSHSTRPHHHRLSPCRLISTGDREAGRPTSKDSDSLRGPVAPLLRRTKIPTYTRAWHGTSLHHLNRWDLEAAAAVEISSRGF